MTLEQLGFVKQEYETFVLFSKHNMVIITHPDGTVNMTGIKLTKEIFDAIQFELRALL